MMSFLPIILLADIVYLPCHAFAMFIFAAKMMLPLSLMLLMLLLPMLSSDGFHFRCCRCLRFFFRLLSLHYADLFLAMLTLSPPLMLLMLMRHAADYHFDAAALMPSPCRYFMPLFSLPMLMLIFFSAFRHFRGRHATLLPC